MNPRHLLATLLFTGCIPVSILGAQCAGALLPVVPACIAGGLICGITGLLLMLSLRKVLKL